MVFCTILDRSLVYFVQFHSARTAFFHSSRTALPCISRCFVTAMSSEPPPPRSSNPPRRAAASAREHIRRNPRRHAHRGRQLFHADDALFVADPEALTRKRTGIVYDEVFLQHQCEWFPQHDECPERLSKIIERCEELDLLSSCTRVPVRPATMEELEAVHPRSGYLDLLEKCRGMRDLEQLEDFCRYFDCLYLHPRSVDVAENAVGGTVDLVSRIAKGELQNGFSLVRPPGHHAGLVPNGYCVFNNLAVAAQAALNKGESRRLLIIDWDVHHGQGTQHIFAGDDRVLLVGIHRFENGAFWPCLAEGSMLSDVELPPTNVDSHLARTAKNILNLPLTKTELGDADYLALWFHVVLPAAFKFNPDLVLVSASAVNHMRLSPALFPHLVRPLMSLAEGKVALVL
ncbi:unnamed protein product, partial [Cyprideis torosa]